MVVMRYTHLKLVHLATVSLRSIHSFGDLFLENPKLLFKHSSSFYAISYVQKHTCISGYVWTRSMYTRVYRVVRLEYRVIERRTSTMQERRRYLRAVP